MSLTNRRQHRQINCEHNGGYKDPCQDSPGRWDTGRERQHASIHKDSSACGTQSQTEKSVTHTHTHTHTHTETESETDRETERERDRQTERRRQTDGDRQTETDRNRETDYWYMSILTVNGRGVKDWCQQIVWMSSPLLQVTAYVLSQNSSVPLNILCKPILCIWNKNGTFPPDTIPLLTNNNSIRTLCCCF